jgi:hypothetical protein
VKLVDLSFDTPRRGGLVAIASPPSGAKETGLWELRGEVVRAAVCFPRSAVPAGRRIKLTVELQSNPAPTQRVWIKATPLKSPHILGSIPPTTVEPGQWVGTHSKVVIALEADVLRDAGVGQHRAAWQWHWGFDANNTGRKLARSEHLLLTTIQPPTDPWSRAAVSPASQTTPWLAALVQACDWGKGAKTERQAAEKIVKAFFALGAPCRKKRVCFRYNGDAFLYMDPGMANPRWFDLERFLHDVARGKSEGPIEINCLEGAAIVATFANLLGCSLDPCVIEGPSCDDLFHLNRIRPLGRSSDQFFREFVFHVVAADRGRSANLSDARIYDTTLKVDADPNPARKPNEFILATGMALGSKTSKPGKAKYFPQLITRKSIKGCSARRVSHAMVRQPPKQESGDVCPVTRYTRYLKELLLAGPSTGAPATGPTILNITGYARTKLVARQPGIPRAGLPRVPDRTQMLFEWKSKRRAIQVDLWIDEDPWVNLSFMAELLATSEVPPTRLNLNGGLAYTVPGKRTVIVFLQGAAARFSSVGFSEVNMVRVYTTAVTSQIQLGRAPRAVIRDTTPSANLRQTD